MSEYTSEHIKRIDDLRAEGYSWADVASEYNKVYGTNKTGNALQKAYKAHFGEDGEMQEEALASSHASLIRARQAASRERKISKAMATSLLSRQAILDGVAEAVKAINKTTAVKLKPDKVKSNTSPMTVELLLSDLQIGKKMVNYNTEIALKRLEGYTQSALFKIEQHRRSGYRIERVVLAVIGDIIESDKKHSNSARATDTGTASQMANAIEGLYSRVLKPIATYCSSQGAKLEVIAVTG